MSGWLGSRTGSPDPDTSGQKDPDPDPQQKNSVADPDQGSGAFLTHGSGMGKNQDPTLGRKKGNFWGFRNSVCYTGIGYWSVREWV
jgi:hypothetical protein